jgi:tetraacyldisaccharide 4'-kinase
LKFTEAILWPFSLLYGAASHLRARAYRTGLLKSQGLNGVVISVGNLTVGGTGKTPMVLWIAEKLLAAGKNVGILTRGYRGESISTTDSAGATASDNTSDEVRLLQARLGHRVLFGVGPDRHKNGMQLAARGVNWFVLDDGFQHLQLARDVNIVLIDAANPFGGGRLLPAGRLREPLSALARADIIVITRSNHAAAVETLIRRHTDAPIFYAQPRIDKISAVTNGRISTTALALLPGSKKLFAFCAIGNPNAFLLTLREVGVEVAGHSFFPDHHRYTPNDAAQILRDARAAGADGLICTEKDLYNLGGVLDAEPNLFCAPISLHIDGEDEFWHQILSIAKSRKAADSAD